MQVKKLPAISVIDAKSNKLYIAVFGLNKTIIEPKIIEKNKLEKFLKKYKNFNFYCDQTNFFYSSFSQHKKDFKLTNKLEPLYLKNPI